MERLLWICLRERGPEPLLGLERDQIASAGTGGDTEGCCRRGCCLVGEEPRAASIDEDLKYLQAARIGSGVTELAVVPSAFLIVMVA